MSAVKLLLFFCITISNLSFAADVSRFKDLEVLVTGGAGFIGSHLVESLVLYGARVTVLDDLSNGNLANLETVRNKICFVKGSVNDINQCLQVTQGKKIVFHLAALISVPDSMYNPLQYHMNNDSGTLNMLEASRINKVERFIFSSSCAVYGDQKDKICSEDSVCNPLSVYGVSKYIGEQYCKEYAQCFNMNIVILRYFNVYGRRQKSEGAYAAVVAKFTENMANNKLVTIYGDGLQTRDFVSVKDVIKANLIFGCYDKGNEVRGEIFNIANGKSISILELFSRLKKVFPQYNQEPIFSTMQPGDIRQITANVSKFKTLLSNTKQNIYT